MSSRRAVPWRVRLVVSVGFGQLAAFITYMHAVMDPDARDVALHEVRKAGKRLRYTAEVGAIGLGKPPTQLVKIAKRVQKALGALQDTVVTREVCRRLAIQAAAAGENSFTFGHLHGLEEARAERARAAFAELEHYYRPPGLPLDRQPWLASVWRRR